MPATKYTSTVKEKNLTEYQNHCINLDQRSLALKCARRILFQSYIFLAFLTIQPRNAPQPVVEFQRRATRKNTTQSELNKHMH